jgi:two-component system sensor kinase FixL
MGADMDSEGDSGPEGALAAELAGAARLAREQAAAIAHYKKMYDRSSALARIGVWECDLATEALTWTDGVYDLFELPRGAPLERARIVALYDEESRLEMERLRAAAISDGGSFALDIRIRTAKGNARWLRLTADVERENGASVRIFGTKQDITAEKAAQDKVQSLQTELIHVSRRSAMGAMAATLAHELNQPLTAISNYAAGTRLALDGDQWPKEVLESGLKGIETNAFRAGNIIRGLRELTSDSPVKREPLDPNPLIREAAALAARGVDERAALRCALAEGVRVPIDPVQLQQVLINLIRNAFEAVRDSDRREILVSTRLADGVAEIVVDDSGPGIRPDLQATLFDAFVTSKPEAIGVGLSISRTIVEAHGGRISAANRKQGGASFRVALPLTAGA